MVEVEAVGLRDAVLALEGVLEHAVGLRDGVRLYPGFPVSFGDEALRGCFEAEGFFGRFGFCGGLRGCFGYFGGAGEGGGFAG